MKLEPVARAAELAVSDAGDVSVAAAAAAALDPAPVDAASVGATAPAVGLSAEDEAAPSPVRDPARSSAASTEDSGRGEPLRSESTRFPETHRVVDADIAVPRNRLLGGGARRDGFLGAGRRSDGLIEVGDDVVDVLQADRDSDQLRRNPAGDLVLGR